MNPSNQKNLSKLIEAYTQIDTNNCDFIVFPPALYLSRFIPPLNFFFGIQDVSIAESGAYTSQISAQMAANIGCKYTIIGHSETRAYLGVTDELVSEKVSRVLEADLTPIVCVGYSQNKAESNINYDELESQISTYVDVLNRKELMIPKQVIIAYEPVWAIGTGKVASNEIITEVVDFIKNYLEQNLQTGVEKDVKVLYGGSVKADNIQELNKIKNLDGYLVGGASLRPQELQVMFESFNSLN